MVHLHSSPAPAGRRRAPCAAHAVLATAALLEALAAQAQPVAKTARPDPLDPAASVPALRYTSAFAPSRQLGDDKPLSWRDANDTVTRIGGWRVYAREAQQPDAALAKPMPAGHGDHKQP